MSVSYRLHVDQASHCWVCVVVQAWECANKLGLIGPAMEQPQYNMFEREKVHMLALLAGIICHLGAAACIDCCLLPWAL